MCSILDPLKPFAIDMVLIDVEGGKIQASIRKPMMKKFKNAIVEGGVYTMINFGVIRSAGNYRAAKHEYKLLFSGKTRLFPAQTELIPLNGLSLVNTEDVFKTNGDSNYLI
ncbi:Nucleic acid-binding, OB-fold, partial [Sesbania bispinosa]